jgi:methionyl-tRNA formyltransferase
MKLIFMGTPAFAVPTLERLAAAGHEIIAVFTQPDRPKGRGQHDAMSPVKESALRLHLSVQQPERVKRPEIVDQIRALAPEAIVVVGYGQIIPKSILDIPPKGIINVHASLLPKYRGAAPIQWAIARGETHTGVTTMKINEGLDTGDMLLKWETEISPEETAPELSARLATAGADLAVKTMAELDSITPQPQDDSQATHAPILKKEDGHIEWQRPAREILNRMRGFDPWPGAYANLRGQKFQIRTASLGEQKLSPGALRAIHKKLYAGCGDGESLELREVQMEGKKRMTAAAFLNGFGLAADEVLA